MGCHSWTYKKVTSLSKKELDDILIQKSESKFGSFVYAYPKEKYVEAMVEDAKDTIEDLGKYENDEEINVSWDLEFAREHLDPEVSEKYWDKCHQEMLESKERVSKFLERTDVDYNEWIDIYGMIHEFDPLREHNGDMYVNVMFDTVFRCRRYSDDECLDSYDKMMKFLKETHPNLIEWYNKSETKEIIHGISDELVCYLKELYKNNDVFVEFG